MKTALSLVAGLALVPSVRADVPTYEVRVVDTIQVTTQLRGASPAGHLVGYQVVTGLSVPFVATEETGLVALPLPDGYTTGIANDANSSGVVVGTVAGTAFPSDGGEPAIWTPDGTGGYDVTIPEQFTVLESPLGPLPAQGGEAVAISDNGTIVGWTRYFGFQGGPTTQFFLSGAPVNLAELGFQATVEAISDHTDVIIGGGYRMDLIDGSVVSLGVPGPVQPGGSQFIFTIGYAVNDAADSVHAAHLATSLPDAYLTYRHSDTGGFLPHNPGVLPSVFPGFYDLNNHGDIAASGGVYFAAEDLLVPGLDGLLDPASSDWDTSLGYLDDARRVATTAVHGPTGTHALVLLVPTVPATVTVRNGSGINPLSFVSLSDPALGSTWTASVDLAATGGDLSLLGLSVAGPVTLPSPFGELLVQAPLLVTLTGVSEYHVPIKASYPLAGLSVQVQAASVSASGVVLTNALDLVLGY